MTRTTAKWVGYASAPLAVVCWCLFATTLSDDVGTSAGLWLGAAVILTVLAAAGLIVASVTRAMEDLTGYGPTQRD